jgi:ATP-binding cassette subfamily B protein
MRSMQRNRDILKHRVKPGTVPRVLTYARPYRVVLAIFLVAVIIDAVVSAVSPLILRALIDRGIIAKNEGLIVALASLVAALAIGEAGLSLIERRISATIGEGLIYDLRSQVFTHIQRMPIAFFSRTQTGALISRLNNDVIGAQQAFTELLSNVVGNLFVVTLILVAMSVLSWQITLVSLVLLPLFLLPARYVGRRLSGMYRHGMDLNAQMNMVMTERFNVAGAMVVKLFGRPEEESLSFSSRAGQVARYWRRPSDLFTDLLCGALFDRLVGYGLSLRLWWRGRRARDAAGRHLGGPGELPHAPLRAAHQPFELERRHHDGPRQL